MVSNGNGLSHVHRRDHWLRNILLHRLCLD
jgi:hypothetical protein